MFNAVSVIVSMGVRTTAAKSTPVIFPNTAVMLPGTFGARRRAYPQPVNFARKPENRAVAVAVLLLNWFTSLNPGTVRLIRRIHEQGADTIHHQRQPRRGLYLYI